MKQWEQNTVFFGIGGFGYGLIELLWRGYTHWTMVFAGGLALLMMAQVERLCRAWSWVYKAALFALGVTGIEFVFGLIFNRWLKMDIWDYSDLPLNLLGQVCLLYTLLWGVLGCAVLPLVRGLNRCFSR